MSDGRSAPAGAPPTNMGIAGTSLGVGLFCGGLVGMIPGIQANKVTALYTAGDVPGRPKPRPRPSGWPSSVSS